MKRLLSMLDSYIVNQCAFQIFPQTNSIFILI
nr:MAG TPA: hypothetical protein [Caudoviricetes sp.]